MTDRVTTAENEGESKVQEGVEEEELEAKAEGEVETKVNSEEIALDFEPAKKKRKIVLCNPDVDASFLPDQEREERVRDEIVRLQREYLEEQEKIKRLITFFIPFFFWKM